VFIPFAALGQGQFAFNNRVHPDIDARFVLATDPAGTSSVGTDFQVQFFAGANGTPINRLQPTDPPSVGFRGVAGTPSAGYVWPVSPVVPNNPPVGQLNNTEVLVRVFNGPTWDTATWRFEGLYAVTVIPSAGPQLLQVGTSPLVLQNVPEPSTAVLSFIGIAGLLIPYLIRRWPAAPDKSKAH